MIVGGNLGYTKPVVELVKREAADLGIEYVMSIVDVTPTDKPLPVFSHATTWEIALRDGDRYVRCTVFGNDLQTDVLRQKLMAAKHTLEQSPL